MKTISIALLVFLYSLGASASGYSENIFVAQQKLNVKKELSTTLPLHRTSVYQQSTTEALTKKAEHQDEKDNDDDNLLTRGSHRAASIAQYIAKLFLVIARIGQFLGF